MPPVLHGLPPPPSVGSCKDVFCGAACDGYDEEACRQCVAAKVTEPQIACEALNGALICSTGKGQCPFGGSCSEDADCLHEQQCEFSRDAACTFGAGSTVGGKGLCGYSVMNEKAPQHGCDTPRGSLSCEGGGALCTGCKDSSACLSTSLQEAFHECTSSLFVDYAARRASREVGEWCGMQSCSTDHDCPHSGGFGGAKYACATFLRGKTNAEAKRYCAKKSSAGDCESAGCTWSAQAQMCHSGYCNVVGECSDTAAACMSNADCSTGYCTGGPQPYCVLSRDLTSKDKGMFVLQCN